MQPVASAGGETVKPTASDIAVLDNGHIPVAAFDLPPSAFFTAGTRQLFVAQMRLWEAISREQAMLAQEGASIDQQRQAYSRLLLPTLAKQRRHFQIAENSARLGGVQVTVFKSEDVVSEQDTALISLHGGGFMFGEDIGAAIEAIPIAAASRVQVISVTYRMAPEHRYPAGTEDVIAVYSALLARNPAMRIGLCGSSAGALLAAQAASVLGDSDLPRPAAVGMFGLGATRIIGDSMHLFNAVERRAPSDDVGSYFIGTAKLDRHTFPAEDANTLSSFPPSLLISSTRDIGLSSVASTHARLVAAGIAAELHIWEGLRHCFYYDPDFTESREVYAVVGEFFQRCLRSGG